LKLNPVGFIDNSPRMLGKVIHGVRVLGRSSDLAEIISVKDVDELLLTIREDESKEIINFCRQAKVRYRIIPSLEDIVNDRIKVTCEEAIS
ncbi:hypothetical protein KKG61_04670, partial [bacterium]|nr:hypothetical protein [bacterium]MBU1599382.1 hypothetical protein [bacterium]